VAGGGSKDDLNLVPFIDLFSTLIVFLIMTAVWNQLETLSTNVDNVTSSDSASANENPNARKETLTVTILKDRVEMSENVTQAGRVLTERNYKIANLAGSIDTEKMRRVLDNWRGKYPEKKDVILNTENQIFYNQMIQTFDLLVGAGFPDVGVNTQ
jgi:biopolymer transport protein ExbD